MILEHAGYMQVFDGDDRLGFRQSRRDLMQDIGSLVGDLPILFGQLADRFLAVLAAFLLATDRPVHALEPLQPSFEGLGVGG
jgi:hypothetical protein